MTQVNLLPPKIKDDISFSKRNASMVKLIVLIVIIGSITIFGLVSMNLIASAGLNFTKNNLAEKEKERKIASMVLVEGKQKDVEVESTRLQRKITAIQAIEREQLFWSKAIEEISVLTPDSVYLKIAPLNAKFNTKFEITGFAVEQLDIARYRNALEDSPLFKFVDVLNFSSSVSEGKPGYSFSMSLQIENPKLLKASLPEASQ